MSDPLALRFHNSMGVLGSDETMTLYKSHMIQYAVAKGHEVFIVLFRDESLYVRSFIPDYHAVFTFENILAVLNPDMNDDQMRVWKHISTHLEQMLSPKNAH